VTKSAFFMRMLNASFSCKLRHIQVHFRNASYVGFAISTSVDLLSVLFALVDLLGNVGFIITS